jgi:hypothetical protein
LLNAQEVWCLDALSADHNGFWDYLNHPENVKYFQVADFTCSMLPSDHFDFLFSFGCFCHVSPKAYGEYMMSLFPNLRAGAHGFVMIADYDKYNHALTALRRSGVKLVLSGRRYMPLRLLEAAINKAIPYTHRLADKNEDLVPRPGRWYHLGKTEACATLERHGYRVVETDVGVNHRDPIMHFVKP